MKPRTFVLLALLTACGSEPVGTRSDLLSHHARRVSGALGTPTPASPLLGLFTIEARVDGAAVSMLVDTGAPLTFVTPSATTPRGSHRIGSLQLGDATLFDVPAIGEDPFGLSPLIGGVLGANVLCQFVTTWDWQRRRFFLGETPRDLELESPRHVTTFSLRGGGTLDLGGLAVAVPPTRILVDAEIEGERRAMILDSGASTSALRRELVDALAASRRSVSLRVTAQGGAVSQRLLRVRSISALGVTTRDAAVVGFSGDGLAALSAEVGSPVDGLLGADLLAPYLTTIEYPSGRLALQRYRDVSHVRDRWTRAGVLVARSAGVWRVSAVFPETSAARSGIAVGAEVSSIDGVSTRGRSLDDVDGMLMGSAGERRTLQSADGRFSIEVEDVIALP